MPTSIVTPILRILRDPGALLSSAFVLDESEKRHQLASALLKNVVSSWSPLFSCPWLTVENRPKLMLTGIKQP